MSSLVETQAVSNEGLLSGTQKPSRIRKYETYAIWISVLSILYNIGEGVVAVFYGDNSDTLSLLFFGIQSFVEVTASFMVLWKVTYFRNKEQSKAQVEAERKLTTVIGIFFLLLSAGTVSSGLLALIRQDKPEETISTIIVSSVCLVLMYIQYIIKMKIANVLNSAVIKGDAKCAFACIQLTFIVFIGCGAYKLAPSGWWIDGVITVILGLIFLKDGIKTMKWAASKEFTGGCCGACGTVVIEKEKGGCQDKCCEDSDKDDSCENEQYNRIVDQEDPCCSSKSYGCQQKKAKQQDSCCGSKNKQEKIDTCCSSGKKKDGCSSSKKIETKESCCSSEKKKQEEADTCCSSEKKQEGGCSSEEKKKEGCCSSEKVEKKDGCCSSKKKEEKVDTCCSSEIKKDDGCSSEEKKKEGCCSGQKKVDACSSSENKQEGSNKCCSSENKTGNCSSEKKETCSSSEKEKDDCCSSKKVEKKDGCCSNEKKEEKAGTCCSSSKKDECCSEEKKKDEPAEVEVKIDDGEKNEDEE